MGVYVTGMHSAYATKCENVRVCVSSRKQVLVEQDVRCVWDTGGGERTKSGSVKLAIYQKYRLSNEINIY